MVRSGGSGTVGFIVASTSHYVFVSTWEPLSNVGGLDRYHRGTRKGKGDVVGDVVARE